MCRNNFNNHNLGKIIDLDVIYTGCGGVIGDVVITPNMTLREVLDAIITNFTSPKPGTQWYIGDDVPTFPANDGDLYLRSDGHVWEYDLTAGWQETDIVLGGGGTGGGTWGTITGDINDQQDLVEFVFTTVNDRVINLAGEGLSYSVPQGKINLGKPYTVPEFTQIVFDKEGVLIGFMGSDGNVDNLTHAAIALTKEVLSLSNDAGTVAKSLTISDTVRLENGSNFISIASNGVTYTAPSHVLSTNNSNINIGNTAISMTGDNVNITANTALNYFIGSTLAMTITSNIITTRRDMYFDANGTGVIIKSPNNSKYRITVDNSGVLSAVLVP